jgi:hypothetical protein
MPGRTRSARPVVVAGAAAAAVALLVPGVAGAQRIQLMTVSKTVAGTAPAADFHMELTCDDGEGPRTLMFDLGDGDAAAFEDATDFLMTYSSGADCTLTETNPQGAARVQIVAASIPGELAPPVVLDLVDLPADATVLEETTVDDPAGAVSLEFTTVVQDNSLDYLVRVVNIFAGDPCTTAGTADALDAQFGDLLDGESPVAPEALAALLADYEEAVAVAGVSGPASVQDDWGMLEQAVDAVDAIFAGVGYDVDALSAEDVEALASIGDEIAPAVAALNAWFQDSCVPDTTTSTSTTTTIPPRVAPRFTG